MPFRGCAGLVDKLKKPPKQTVAEDSDRIRPVARPDGIQPPASARTVEEFDTTTEQERVAALNDGAGGTQGRFLGRTVASLGSPTEPGIWLKTPLVSQPSKGRIEYLANGKSVSVDLIPIEGDAGSGSRISLAAMRLIEANLTDLPELEVRVVTD